MLFGQSALPSPSKLRSWERHTQGCDLLDSGTERLTPLEKQHRHQVPGYPPLMWISVQLVPMSTFTRLPAAWLKLLSGSRFAGMRTLRLGHWA